MTAEPENPKVAALRAIFPDFPVPVLNDVATALDGMNEFDSFLGLLGDASNRQSFREGYRKALDTVSANPEDPAPGGQSWIREFVQRLPSPEIGNRTAAANRLQNTNREQWRDSWKERLRDIAAFDALVKANPELLSKLAAQGIDLEAEKKLEHEQLKRSNPSMSVEEAGARSALAVYLRHQEAIYRLIPDASARKEFDTGFDNLRRFAREAGVPYQEPVWAARDISSGDKASILAATAAGASFETKSIRTGNELRFESQGDRFLQVWVLRPGERPEKAVELPNGPRIKVASAPERNEKLMEMRNRAVDDIAELTNWEGVRTEEGLSLARKEYPKSLIESCSKSMAAPFAWRTFVSNFSAADKEGRSTLAAVMRQQVAATSDPELSRRMSEALDDLVSTATLDDNERDFLEKMGERHGQLIQSEACSAKSRAEKRGEKFQRALDIVDASDETEGAVSREFQQDVERTEAVARENLAYLESAGYVAAFGRNFDDFLSIVNIHRLKIYPNAGAPIALPMVLREPDRALMAHALTRAISEEANIDEYFEVPSYRLKKFDVEGVSVSDKVDRGLKKSGIWNERIFNLQALDQRLASPSVQSASSI